MGARGAGGAVEDHALVVIPVLAVVDAEGTTVVVWWVDVQEPSGLNRLCGAWVLPAATAPVVEDLVFGRYLLATPEGAALLGALGVSGGRSVDAAETLAAVAQVLDELARAHDEHARTLPRGRALVAPAWPVLPQWPRTSDGPTGGNDVVARALGIAGWVTSLCTAWSSIEGQRLARPHLRGLGGPQARILPVRAVGDATSAAPRVAP